jgi:membrane-associated phospholipid phosphatase
MRASRLAALAVLLFAAFVVLGMAVSHVPPGALDRAAVALRGHGVEAAVFFTRAGTFGVYVAVCVALLVFGLARREWLGRVLLSIAALAAVWQVSDLCKFAFHRLRPDDWLVIPETSYSYPSGHATLALAFYGLWACYLVEGGHSSAARRVGAAALVALILVISWSRLALRAHFATDVLGGWLLGGAFLCLALVAEKRLALSRLA